MIFPDGIESFVEALWANIDQYVYCLAYHWARINIFLVFFLFEPVLPVLYLDHLVLVMWLLGFFSAGSPLRVMLRMYFALAMYTFLFSYFGNPDLHESWYISGFGVLVYLFSTFIAYRVLAYLLRMIWRLQDWDGRSGLLKMFIEESFLPYLFDMSRPEESPDYMRNYLANEKGSARPPHRSRKDEQ